MSADTKLGPARRLKKRREYLHLQSSRLRIKVYNFVIAFERKPKGVSRIGITISKKVDKRAVKRNSLKRKIKEIYRQIRPDLLHIVDIVIIAQSGACEMDSKQIKAEMVKGLLKAKLLPKDMYDK